MTPQEIKKEIDDLKREFDSLKSSSTIPRNIETAFTERLLRVANISGTLAVASGGTGATTLTGIIKGNGTSAMTTITPLAGTKVYYVADSSGGTVNRKLTFNSGILVSET